MTAPLNYEQMLAEARARMMGNPPGMRMTQPQQAPQQAPQAPQPQPQQAPGTGGFLQPGGVMDRIMGGDSPMAQLLPQDQRQNALRQGLLGAGLSMVQASGRHPQGTGKNLAQIMAGGLQAGQEGYQGGVGSSLQAQQMRQQLEMQQRRQEIMVKYADSPQDRDTMQRMFNDLIAIGDYEGAKPLAEVMKAGANDLHIMEADNGLIYAIDKRTGKEVNRIGISNPAGGIIPLSDTQFNQMEQITDNFERQTGKFQEQAQSFGRVKVAASNLMTAMREGRGNDAAASSLALVYAYAKLLDPGSVVREGELRLTLSQGSVFDQITNMWKRAKEGTMSPRLVESMMREAMGQVNAAQGDFNRYVATSRERVQRQIGIDPNTFIYTNPFEGKMSGLPQEWIDQLANVRVSRAPATAGDGSTQVPFRLPPEDEEVVAELFRKYPWLSDTTSGGN